MSYLKTSTTPSAPASSMSSASSFWAMMPECHRADILRDHVERALHVVNEHHLPLPDTQERFVLAVMLAVEAELIFFNACLYEPSSEDFDRFFADFLRRVFQAETSEVTLI